MSNNLVVGISDYKLSKGPNIIVTYALGSCVGICLYDAHLKIGGLSHIMLPESKMFSNNNINRMKFADTALFDMTEALKAMGASPRRLVAKIAGGAQMFQTEKNSNIGTIGARNVSSVKQVLARLKIPIAAESTGSNYGRTLYFDLDTGIMKVQALGRSALEL